MSQKTGTPPARTTASAVAKKLNAGTSTSAPGASRRARRAITRASVPLATPTTARGAEKAGEGALELLDFGALDERVGVEDLVPALTQGGIDALAGARQVENRDWDHGDSVSRGSAASSATAASGWRVHGVS